MPLMEQLDNDGNPTGYRRNFTTNEYNKLMRLKSCKWRLIENDYPRHRDTATEYPTGRKAVLTFIEETQSIDMLNDIVSKDGRKSVRDAAVKRIDELTNK